MSSTIRQAALVTYRAASDTAAKAAMFAITIAAARRLAPHSFGMFSLAVTLGWMLSVTTDCGMQLHLARRVAQAPDCAGQQLRPWLRVRVALSAATLALVAAAVGADVLMSRLTATDGAAVVLLVATYLISGLSEFVYYFFRGLGRSDLESSLTLAQRGTTVVAAVALLWWHPSLILLSALLLLPAILTLGLALDCAGRVAPEPAGSDRGARIEPSLAREFVRDVLPLGAGIVASALYFRIDLFLVGSLAGVDAAGVYNAVFRIIDALRLFPAAVLAVLLPSIFRARDSRTLIRVSIGLTLFGLAVSAAGWVTASWLVPFVYGARYGEAVPTFRILLLAFPLLSLNYALTHQLIGWRGQRGYAAICVAALAINLVLNARLIPASGMLGAAWATLGTEIFLTVACVVQLRMASARAAGVLALGVSA